MAKKKLLTAQCGETYIRCTVCHNWMLDAVFPEHFEKYCPGPPIKRHVSSPTSKPPKRKSLPEEPCTLIIAMPDITVMPDRKHPWRCRWCQVYFGNLETHEEICLKNPDAERLQSEAQKRRKKQQLEQEAVAVSNRFQDRLLIAAQKQKSRCNEERQRGSETKNKKGKAESSDAAKCKPISSRPTVACRTVTYDSKMTDKTPTNCEIPNEIVLGHSRWRCRHCGKPGMPGEDTCYSCHSK